MMQRHRRTAGMALTAALAAALTVLAFVGSASAKLTGEYTKFENCPRKNAETFRCLHSLNFGGEVKLGNKTVKVENPVTLQGGYKKPVERISEFIAATNGQTLTKAKQNVPGGLLGIVPPEKSPWLVQKLSKFFFENSLTGVTSTLELAAAASKIQISELNLSQKIGIALKMPVRVHLENPFLGGSCFVGTESSPITLELYSGKTPDEKLVGTSGKIQFLDGGRILRLNEAKLVSNNWSAPKASGCGGILSFLVNPIINAQVGLPSAAGNNQTVLENTVSISSPAAVNKNDEENP
jgi:hypothetical protein